MPVTALLQEAIDDALRNRRMLVVIETNEAAQSDLVLHEYALFRKFRRPTFVELTR